MTFDDAGMVRYRAMQFKISSEYIFEGFLYKDL